MPPEEENKEKAANTGNETEQVDIIAQNIETIADLHIHAERKVGTHQRAIERVTASLGRPRFLYIILLFVLLWLTLDTLCPDIGLHPFDVPPYSLLQGIISLSALLMTTLVLITQNRQNNVTEQRRRLDLQVNLVIEQKVTKLISLLEELRQDIPHVKDRHDPEAESMQKPVDPHEVLSSLNKILEDADVPHK